jgi:hypothetical protein
LREHATNRVGDGRSQAVAVGVDADHPINVPVSLLIQAAPSCS